MSDKKTSQSIWKTVLRISSRDIALIQEKDDLLAAYKGLEELVYDFAQEVNQICVKFFKDNSFTPDQGFDKDNIPESFQVFNSDVLLYYNLYDAELAGQNVLIQKESILNTNIKDICIRLTKEENFQDTNFQELETFFIKAEWFYNKICKKNSSLELYKKYEKIQSYFNQIGFDIFAMFDVSPLYLSGKFNKNYAKLQEQGKVFDEWVKKAETLIQKTNRTEEEEIAHNEKLSTSLPSPELISQKENGWIDSINLYKKIPLNGIRFFRLTDNDTVAEYTLAELQKEHSKINQ